MKNLKEPEYDLQNSMRMKSLMKHCIIPLMNNIAKILADEFDVKSPNSEHYHFAGLCDVASSMLILGIDNYCKKYSVTDVVLYPVHGELAHKPFIPKEYWGTEHTWVSVSIGNIILYLDVTSKQFQHICSDIPDGFIATQDDIWYLPDRKNLYWRLPFQSLDPCTPFNRAYQAIVHFFQFKVWGSISNIIYDIKMK